MPNGEPTICTCGGLVQQQHAANVAAMFRGRREAELAAQADGHRMIPIPVPPFRDDLDRRAALAAALAVVANAVTGRWPAPHLLQVAVRALDVTDA